MMDRQRTGMPGPSSHTSKRASSPSQTARHSERPSNGRLGQAGPMGTYRAPPKDDETETASHVHSTSRFGFAGPSASISTSLAGLVKRPNASQTSTKRSVSNAGLVDPNSSCSTSNGTIPNKRPFLTSAGGQRHEQMENEFKRKELLAQQAQERLQQEYDAQGRELEKQQEERLALLRQWESLSADFHEEKMKLAEEKKVFQGRLQDLQERNNELTSHVDIAESERDRVILQSQKAKTDDGIRIATVEAELLEARAFAQAESEAKIRVQKELLTREVEWSADRERLLARKGNLDESTKLTAELSSLLSKMRAMEAENAVLRHENSQHQGRRDRMEILKEQKRDLEKKASASEELRKMLAQAEIKVTDLEAEKSQWDFTILQGHETQAYGMMYGQCSAPDTDIPKIETPTSVNSATMALFVSQLQGAVAGLAHRSQTLANRCNAQRTRALEDENILQREVQRAERLLYELDQKKMACLKAEKSCETLAAEVDAYKRLLNTYQEEAKTMSAQFDVASGEQITLLQGQLESRQRENEQAKYEMEELRAQLSRVISPGGQTAEERREMEGTHEVREKELLHALQEKQEALDDLEGQCVSLGKANDELFARLGRGEFDQSKLRALELTNNPVTQDRAIRTKMLEALRKENAELLEQVKGLSKKVGRGAETGQVAENDSLSAIDLIPIQTLNNLQSQYDKLEKAMHDRDKAFDRLKEVFGAKATEYVAAVKALFGYDMHVLSRGKVKLRSVYGRTSKGTSLTFDSGEEADVASMRLVGEARLGAANVDNLKRYWLGADRSSLPCFLAALQLELYESTTQAVRVGWTEEDGEE